MTDYVKVLSIDGGGIRGIIPAMVLAYLEDRTGKRIYELFDLVVGNSTGGIIALGLTQPNPRTAEELVGLYAEKGSTIFNPRPFHTGMTGELYDEEGLERTLAEYFGDAELKEALVKVMVLSYDLENRTPHFFKSHKAVKDGSRNFYLRDVARATSAAPTYFEPAQVKTVDCALQFNLIDGGVVANNPALCGYSEARFLPEFQDKDILLVSIGTGMTRKAIAVNRAKKWGKLEWAPRILDVVFDGTCDAIENHLEVLLPAVDGQKRYYRLQTRLTHANEKLDDTSSGNIANLKKEAQAILTEFEADIDMLCEQIMSL